MTEILSLRSQLDTLAGTGECIRRAMENQLAPFFDGRVEDRRSADLRTALADLFAAADRVGATARKDLEQLAATERADTRNREAHERAEGRKS